MPDISSAALDTAQNALISGTNYLSLHTGDTAGTGADEGTDGRQAITFASSSGGSQASTDAQTWSSPAGSQTYTHFGVWTASSGGTFIRGGVFNASFTPTVSVAFTISTGNIVLTDS